MSTPRPGGDGDEQQRWLQEALDLVKTREDKALKAHAQTMNANNSAHEQTMNVLVGSGPLLAALANKIASAASTAEAVAKANPLSALGSPGMDARSVASSNAM